MGSLLWTLIKVFHHRMNVEVTTIARHYLLNGLRQLSLLWGIENGQIPDLPPASAFFFK